MGAGALLVGQGQARVGGELAEALVVRIEKILGPAAGVEGGEGGAAFQDAGGQGAEVGVRPGDGVRIAKICFIPA